jgi:hypothetical protein
VLISIENKSHHEITIIIDPPNSRPEIFAHNSTTFLITANAKVAIQSNNDAYGYYAISFAKDDKEATTV